MVIVWKKWSNESSQNSLNPFYFFHVNYPCQTYENLYLNIFLFFKLVLNFSWKIETYQKNQGQLSNLLKSWGCSKRHWLSFCLQRRHLYCGYQKLLSLLVSIQFLHDFIFFSEFNKMTFKLKSFDQQGSVLTWKVGQDVFENMREYYHFRSFDVWNNLGDLDSKII